MDDARSFYSTSSMMDVTHSAKDNIFSNGDKKNPLDEVSTLRRTLMAEEGNRPCVSGVLAVRVKESNFISTKEHTQTTHENTYCTVSIRNFCKKTHVRTKDHDRISWGQSKHFPVIVPRSRKHPFNLLRIQLHEFDSCNPSAHRELGSVSFHLHDIVSVSPINGTFDVWDQNHLIGDMKIEITFSYGTFGFGYSNQLKEERRKPEEMIAYSLFPRINPPKELQEAERSVMAVKALPHPSFIPFKENAYLSYGKELGQLAVASQYKPDDLTPDNHEIEEIRDHYFSMNDRVARIMFLHNYLFCANTKPEITADNGPQAVGVDGVTAADLQQRTYVPFVQPFNVPISITEDQFIAAATARRNKTQQFIDKSRTNPFKPLATNTSLTPGEGLRDVAVESDPSVGRKSLSHLTSQTLFGQPRKRSISFAEGKK